MTTPTPERGLRGRDFSLWVGARFSSQLGRRMAATALAWQIFRLIRNPVALGLLGLAEAVPFLLSSPWAGHLVDRHHKKPFMLGAESALLLCAVLYFALGSLARPPLIAFYAVVGLGGAAFGFGGTASIVYLQLLVPKENFPRAAAWNLASFTVAIILGPLVAGGILSVAPARAVYAASAGLSLAALGLVSLLRFRPAPTETGDEEPTLTRILDGIRFVRSRRLLFACMSLDMIAVLFGDAVAVFPLFADFWKAGPLGFGILRAAPAVGASLVSLVQGWKSVIRPSWKTLKTAVTAFGACMIAFALSRNMGTAVFFLILAGVADGVSVITRQSLYQAHVPDALRGRVAALSGIFVSASNEIGSFESGVAARLLGTVASVVFGGIMTLATVATLGWKFRDVGEN